MAPQAKTLEEAYRGLANTVNGLRTVQAEQAEALQQLGAANQQLQTQNKSLRDRVLALEEWAEQQGGGLPETTVEGEVVEHHRAAANADHREKTLARTNPIPEPNED